MLQRIFGSEDFMSEQQPQGNGWKEKYILDQLKRSSDGIADINLTMIKVRKEITDLKVISLGEIRVELAKLKITAGVWGAIAGAIPSLAAVIWLIFQK